MGLLSAGLIRKLINELAFISQPPYDSKEEWDKRVEFIEGSQFDLTTSRLFIRKPNQSPPFMGRYSRELGDLEEIAPQYNEFRKEYTWVLEAGKHYVAMTGEIVTMPPTLKGILRPRSSDFIMGLYPGVTDISPGFSGMLRFGLYASETCEIGRGSRQITMAVVTIEGDEETDTYQGIWGKSGGSVDKITTEDGGERPH